MSRDVAAEHPNAAQREFWNGPGGEHWTRCQDALDATLEPFGRAALECARVASGERVLDVGCGCGATTLALAQAVGAGGRVVGVDVSGPMLARARQRAAALSQARFVEADASTAMLDDAPFDRIFSRFGVMFFDAPEAAFGHLRSLLRPGGAITFACWRAPDENPHISLPLAAALPFLPPAPGPAPAPDAPGPFAFAERARIERVLAAAGFVDARVEPFDTVVALTDGGLEAAVEYTIQVGPLARRWGDLADETTRVAVRGAVREALRPHTGPRGVVALAAAAWVVSARA